MTASRAVQVAAVDLGASSGRVMLGEVGGGRVSLRAVHRFGNEPVRTPDGLHWNLLELYRQALAGLRTAAASSTGLASVGIDTWAVDHGLLRDGRLLGTPYHYRDERRCEAGPASVHAVVSQEKLYLESGLQYLPFNTVYQLAADPWVAQADRLLLVPDLIGHWLTGEVVAERTNASTTGLVDPVTREWNASLMERLGLRPSLFPALVDPGTTIGPLLPDVAEQVGAPGLELVAVGSHDTASAVVGVPMLSPNAAYLSLGTWGLVGVELDEPVVTEESRAANFTNEGGVDGTVRFLTNVMGTWLLSEALRTWRGRGTAVELTDLLAAAAEVTGPVPLFDVQDPRFLPPGDMPGRIEAWCDEHLVAPPTGPAAVVRSIVESLAAAYALAVDRAATLSGRRVDVVHVVGGGAQNALLCQAIADRSGLEVLAGPVEATALGNVLVQARAAGATGPDLADLRELVVASHDLARFRPR